MSSVKKVLCLKAKNNHDRVFTTGNVYGVEYHAGYYRANDDHGLPTAIFIDMACLYGEWQPLEEYVCMTNMFAPMVKLGDVVTGYMDNGILKIPSDINLKQFGYVGGFKKLSEMPQKAKSYQRHEVRHVIYDTKDNKIVNDAMGECYITLAEAQELCDEMNAPKVMKPKYTKEVEYFGVKFMVPEDTKWMCATRKGEVCAWQHSEKPYFLSSGFFVSNACGEVIVGGVDLNGIDWKETLVEIK